MRRGIMAGVLALALFAGLLAGCGGGTVPDRSGDLPGLITTLPVEDALVAPCEHKGTVERLVYTCHSYALEAVASGKWEEIPLEADGVDRPREMPEDLLPAGTREVLVQKELYVYLPWGYDPSERYDILYLLHGTTSGADYWLGDHPVGLTTRNLLDRMMDSGVCRPVIVVSPTYYSVPDGMWDTLGDLMNEPLANLWPAYFWLEMRHDIIPLVEGRYATHAGGDVSESGLRASRDHRAFAGLSRGSSASVNSILFHCLDLFTCVGSFSGIWADFDRFQEIMESDPFRDYDLRLWYNGNGTADIALADHQAFRDRCLNEMPDRFTQGENYIWVCFEGGSHSFGSWLADLYNSLALFFPA